MQHYCGIDLHSNNHVVVVIDEEDKRVFEKRLNNDLSITLRVLSLYQETLQGVAVESTFNWYWLVDGLQEHGYHLRLVNTSAVKQYDGLKYSGDYHDAFHLAHLMRLGILPTGHIYPKQQRAIRDLLRRRLSEEQIVLSDQDFQPELIPVAAVVADEVQETVLPEPVFQDIQLVSRSIDWSMVSSCVANETTCVCYGLSAERLVVPSSSCELAVRHGWPSESKRQHLSL